MTFAGLYRLLKGCLCLQSYSVFSFPEKQHTCKWLWQTWAIPHFLVLRRIILELQVSIIFSFNLLIQEGDYIWSQYLRLQFCSLKHVCNVTQWDCSHAQVFWNQSLYLQVPWESGFKKVAELRFCNTCNVRDDTCAL